MQQIKSLDELRRVRERVEKDMSTRRDTGTTIIVGMGTCGIASGARETMRAILEEIRSRDMEVNVTTVGCIGMCAREPLVDIEQAGKPRVSYGNITPDMVSRLIEEHLVNGNVVDEWVVGRLQEED